METSDATGGTERFQLFSYCAGMLPSVSVSENDIDLTEDRIGTMVESRLRAARLYGGPDQFLGGLMVWVDVTDRAFVIDLEYAKTLYDPVSDDMFMASPARFVIGTRAYGSFGTHGGDSGYIMQGISESLDTFIGDYLRVNEEAC